MPHLARLIVDHWSVPPKPTKQKNKLLKFYVAAAQNTKNTHPKVGAGGQGATGRLSQIGHTRALKLTANLSMWLSGCCSCPACVCRLLHGHAVCWFWLSLPGALWQFSPGLT